MPGAGRVEDYTVPFLVAAGVLCFVALFAIWAVWGLPVVLVLAFLANKALPKR